MCFGECFLFEKVFRCDINVKTVLSVLCFEVFYYFFFLKPENKSEKDNGLTNKTTIREELIFVQLTILSSYKQ
jgi:hypothetical protein